MVLAAMTWRSATCGGLHAVSARDEVASGDAAEAEGVVGGTLARSTAFHVGETSVSRLWKLSVQ